MALQIRLLALALLAGCSGAGEEGQRESGVRSLSGPEVRKVLTGNTLVGHDREGPFWMYYPDDGTLWGHASNGDVDIGTWRIEGNHYCRSWRRWRSGEEKCWLLATDGHDGLIWIEPDGASSGVSTIQAGNTIGRLTRSELIAAYLGEAGAQRRERAAPSTPIDGFGNILIARNFDTSSEPSGIDSGPAPGEGPTGGSGSSSGASGGNSSSGAGGNSSSGAGGNSSSGNGSSGSGPGTGSGNASSGGSGSGSGAGGSGSDTDSDEGGDDGDDGDGDDGNDGDDGTGGDDGEDGGGDD